MNRWRIAAVAMLLTCGVSFVRFSSVGAALQEPRAEKITPGSVTDYIDETTGVVTRVFPGTASSFNFLQATATGGGRDVVAQLTPIEHFEPKDTDDEISLRTGDIVITTPYIRLSPDSYTISYRFHIPRDVLPEDLQHLATLPNVAAANPLQKLIGWVAPTLLANEGAGVSGVVSQTYVPNTAVNNAGSQAPRQFPPDAEYEQYRKWYQHEAERGARAEAQVVELERRLIGQTLTTGRCTDPQIAAARDYVQRARDLADDEIRFGRLTPAQQAASGQGSELATRRTAIDAELRSSSRTTAPSGSSAPPAAAAPPGAAAPAGSSSGTAARTAAGGARTVVRVAGNTAAGVSSALTLADIEADSERWRKRLRDLRECADNPTNPTARRARTEDPNYNRATRDRIRAGEMEEQFVTNTRRTALTLNTGAGFVFRLLGSAAIGVMGEVEDSLLERSMEETMAGLEACVVQCDLKRALQVSLRFVHTEGESGCFQSLCTEWQRTANVASTATLMLVGNQSGYEGTSQATFTSTYNATEKGPDPQCPTTTSTETVNGALTMEAKAYFSTDNDQTGGLAVGRRKRSVLEMRTTTGSMKGTASRNECGKVTNTATLYEENQFDCHFYDVDLKAGGTYTVFKDRNAKSGTCTATITPRQ